MKEIRMSRQGIKGLCLLLAMLLIFWAVMPMGEVRAAQENHYHDPVDNWLTAGNRTSELDANAVVTKETFTCFYCGKQTQFTVWRTPEYTKDGKSALSHNVMFSDGTMVDGKTVGSIMDGTPGVDAYYTGYHWSKAVCEKCNTMNSHGEVTNYEFNKNVYMLYDCDTDFTEELPDEVTYEYADKTYHTKTTKGGTYCCFCFGTHKTEDSKLEKHDVAETIRPELAHQRFVEMEKCTLCDYTATDYVAAKSVVASYYGVLDGKPHTVTVSDLSDKGVSTKIRYGNSADSCTLTSAPNYTDEGQYTVYYEITYTYNNTDMTENGVAYVWLHDETAEDDTCDCGCGAENCDCLDKNCSGGCCGNTCGDKHHFVLLDSTKAGCLTLGYDRYLCTNCGKIEKRNYVNATDHAWQQIVVREATCEVGGKVLNICRNCGEVKEETTAKGEHSYTTYTVKPTCVGSGYTVKECKNCGDRHITDIEPAAAHKYESIITPASCELGGSTLHLCSGCGSSFVTDYTEPTGHSWDEDSYVTNATCTGDGVMEYRCVRCGYHRLEGDLANGHIPGKAVSCTENQVCEVCGAILVVATGHSEGEWIVDKEPTLRSEGSRHKECKTCGETLQTESIDRLTKQDITDNKGEVTVGGYLVIVTDTQTDRLVYNAEVSLTKDSNKEYKLQIALPKGKLLDYDRQTTITVKLAKNKTAVKNLQIEVIDRNGNVASGTTDRLGQVTVPAGDKYINTQTITHKAYVQGYPDGSFQPNGNVTRAEAAAMLARLLAEDKGDSIWGRMRFRDVASGSWYADYINYLAGYGIAVGRGNNEFAPNAAISRAEFVAMAVRFCEEYGEGRQTNTTNVTRFADINSGYWGAEYIAYAAGAGWVVGYGDGSFRPNEGISRAEMVTVMNRLLKRTADEEYIADNLRKLVTFSDVSKRYWAWADIMEAANSHKAEVNKEGESWTK